uniref:Odorant receptor n=1 Tax=Meteorus pulchricornis TaxID=51522 RepID=A0A1S5VFL9_9HYME|nr:olfactory receptor 32 [Meteorus pulchricornis]
MYVFMNEAISHNVPVTITIIIEIVELAKFVINRNEVMSVNAYTQQTFWNALYDASESEILDECNRKSIRMVATDFVLAQGFTWLHLCIPLIEYSGYDDSTRELPFRMHFNWPLAETPYYEIAYVVELFSAMGVTTCAVIFAGYLGTMNFYTAGQFKILQRQLENSIKDMDKMRVEDLMNQVKFNAICGNIKNCIKQHQLLILYIDRIENLFNVIMLIQTLGSVALLCFSGFQILLDDQSSILRTTMSVVLLIVSIVQLFLFAWPCHEIITESQEVSEAAYRALWFCLPYNSEGRACRQLLLIVITRARRPCVLTVGKFAPMSLQTFASVFNTAISYFTVLRQMNESTEQ